MRSDETREEGYLTDLLREAGFTVEVESVVETPMLLADASALAAALGASPDAAAPFRRADGSYLLRNHFRYAVAARRSR